MKKFIYLILISVFVSCGDSKGPDVSHIEVNLPIERFEESFFTIDTNHIPAGLQSVAQKHPDFYIDFMKELLGVSGEINDTTTLFVTKEFLRGYLPIFDSLRPKFRDLEWLKNDLEDGYRHVKYYFPSYKSGKAITFIGPFDMPGTALTSTGLAIGLHQYAGRNFSVYQSAVGQQLFPNYISRRFEPEYITANCMKAVVLDMFPDRSTGKGLIEQMIEKGKQWWLLDKFLPEMHDSLKTGYTANQVEFCKRNEGLIWQTIITNEKDLYTIEPVSIQTYIGEAPFTQNMGENSPGNIGPWVGWQIVKKFESRNLDLDFGTIMSTEPRKILDEARYKPK